MNTKTELNTFLEAEIQRISAIKPTERTMQEIHRMHGLMSISLWLCLPDIRKPKTSELTKWQLYNIKNKTKVDANTQNPIIQKIIDLIEEKEEVVEQKLLFT